MAIKLSTANKKIPGKYNAEDMQPHDTIAAIITTGSGEACKYLVLDHVKCDMLTCPIGKVKPDQTVVEALLEECEEEVGAKLSNYKEIIQFHKTYNRESKDIEVKTHVFKVIKYTGTIKNLEPKKHRWVRWMTRKELENSKRKLSDALTAYFEWLDEANRTSIIKPQVTVGNGKV